MFDLPTISDAELCPACGELGVEPFGQDSGLKGAADSMAALLAHLSFLGVGALGAGLLFISSYGSVPRITEASAIEGLEIDAERVRVPVLTTPPLKISLQPRPPADQTQESPRSTVRPIVRRPMPPTAVIVESVGESSDR
jgi:hypothetical protein